MKVCTDIEQSKKLAEFLPLETADMCYSNDGTVVNIDTNPYLVCKYMRQDVELIPCWSLAGLLDYLSANFRVDIKYLDNYWELDCRVQVTYNKELIDACYEMILKLHEQKIL